MIDTVFYKIDLLVNGQERFNDICPIVIEHATKVCNQNAISLAFIVCGTIFFVAIVAALSIRGWQIRKNKLSELEKLKEEKKKLEEDICKYSKTKVDSIGKLTTFLEELSKNDKCGKMREFDNKACQEYIRLLTHLATNDNLDNYNSNRGVDKREIKDAER